MSLSRRPLGITVSIEFTGPCVAVFSRVACSTSAGFYWRRRSSAVIAGGALGVGIDRWVGLFCGSRPALVGLVHHLRVQKRSGITATQTVALAACSPAFIVVPSPRSLAAPPCFFRSILLPGLAVGILSTRFPTRWK